MATKDTNNKAGQAPTAARVLGANEWAELRELIAEGELSGVELTAGAAGTAAVDARTGNRMPGALSGPGVAPNLPMDLRHAASIVRAQSGNVVLLNSSFVQMLTRFSQSSGITEASEDEDKLRELCDEILHAAGVTGIAVAIQSRQTFNNYTLQGVGAPVDTTPAERREPSDDDKPVYYEPGHIAMEATR
jgi:hypothetical protein